MAAVNESQGLKIAVAAFITLTVILAVTSYFLYSSASSAQARLDSEKDAHIKGQEDGEPGVESVRRDEDPGGHQGRGIRHRDGRDLRQLQEGLRSACLECEGGFTVSDSGDGQPATDSPRGMGFRRTPHRPLHGNDAGA
jgi:hypothetical protein